MAPGGHNVGLRFEDPSRLTHTTTRDHIRPGGYDPNEHVKDMDIDGIDMSILYPGVGLVMHSVPDGELLTAMFTVYSDWLAEFCSAYPDRLNGIGMINTDDLPSAVKELERCASLGFVGAMTTVYPPQERAYDLPEYDTFWATAQDLQIPISLHSATNRPGPNQTFVNIDDVRPHFACNLDHWVRNSLAQIIFSGVFQRFPNLYIGSVEHELSWVPHFLDRLDYALTQRARDLYTKGYWDRYTGDLLPSEHFHNNVFVGFQEDAFGIRSRDVIGVDNLQRGSDYPYTESTFPRSGKILEDILADCTEEEKAKIASGNASRVYRLN